MSESEIQSVDGGRSRGQRWLRVVVCGVLAATVLRVWLGGPELSTPVYAQIPDSGMQRKLMIEESRKTNQHLSDILKFLKSGKLKVQIDGTDKPAKVR